MAHAAPLVEVSESVAMLACTVHSPCYMHILKPGRFLLVGLLVTSGIQHAVGP